VGLRSEPPLRYRKNGDPGGFIMLKSMTGFASLSREHELATVGVTVRSVNHRYLDLQVRLPSSLARLETSLRNLVQQGVGRGRVELAVTTRSLQPPTVAVSLNEPLAEALTAAVEAARAKGLVEGRLTSGDLLRFPQAVTVQEQETTTAAREALETVVTESVCSALKELDAMRAREGEFLANDLASRCETLAHLVVQFETAAAEGAEGLRQRLHQRLEDLRSDAPGVDGETLSQELVKYVARSDVSEELTRLRGHLAHWSGLVDGDEPCGRKLDFLLQEMNREINTLGAKSEGTGISELVVAAKAELEKLREQVQNVE